MTNPDRDELVKLADGLEGYSKKYSGDWSRACPTIAWTDLTTIVTALRRLAEAVAQEADLPADGSCTRCGAVPPTSSGLCNTCLDEDAERYENAPAAQSIAVKVKALEWVEREGVTGTFDASTSVGHYIATITDDDRGMWFIVGQTTGEYMQADIRAVRAAAQADYEQRIMAAIETAPQPDNQPSLSRKLVYETGKELPENAEQQMNNADVSVGELAGFFSTEFPPLMTMSTQIEVARALLARYRIERLDRLESGRK